MDPRTMKHLIPFLLALCTALPIGSAWARIELAGASNDKTPQAVATTAHVRAELMAHAPQGFSDGQTIWLGVQLTPEPGWHTYWKNPGDSGLATQLNWSLPKGWQTGTLLWPTPDVLPVGDRVNYGYDRPVLLSLPVTIKGQTRTGVTPPADPSPTVKVQASWLVCKTECIPESVNLSWVPPLTNETPDRAAIFASAQAEQPQSAPHLQARAQLQGHNLSLNLTGLPHDWQGQPLWLLPETADIVSTSLSDANSTAAWSNQTAPLWQLTWPLSALREQSPQRLKWVVRRQSTPQGALTFETPIQGEWPAEAPTETTPLSPPPVGQDPTETLSWGAVLGALVGGLILNLMPCVFPVLAIKLLSLLKTPATASSSWGHSLRAQCLAYSLGVVASFMVLGGLMLALRAGGAQLGWGFQLQSPWMIVFLALLFTAMALNLLGVYEWRGAWGAGWSQVHWRHPMVDSLVSGVLAVLIASPCTAPFMGTSLGLTLTLPALSALAVFAALGLGMALPYLLLGLLPSAAPWWIRHLPKPGVWMQTFKQLMAFPLLATVVWLLWVLGQQLGIEGMAGTLGLLLALSGGLWTWGMPDSTSTRLRTGLIGLFLALGALLAWTWADLATHPTGNAPTATPTSANSQPSWQAWKPGLAETLAAQGHPVFVDFTAAWCVTCQFNKHATLSNPGLLQDLAHHQVVLMRADWTRQDPAISQALHAFGRSGVPVYVVYLPNQAPVVLSELLSVAEVRAALRLGTS